MINKYFIYEVHERLDPYNSQFACYVIFDVSKNKIMQYVSGINQRTARTNCKEFINLMSLHDETEPIIVWRNWPILVQSKDINDKSILERIHKREVI